MSLKLFVPAIRKAIESVQTARSFPLRRLSVIAIVGIDVLLSTGSMTARQDPARQIWADGNVGEVREISPDDHYAAFVDPAGDLTIRDLGSGATHKVTDTGGSQWRAEGGTFSPDARRVAYSWSNRRNATSELYVANTSGDPNPRKLFANEEWITPFDWSPDGRWLAVLRGRKRPDADIGLVSLSDGAFRSLKMIDWSGTSNVVFSPDGKYLAFDRRDLANRDVFVLAVDDPRDIKVVAGATHDESVGGPGPSVVGWSPDGKRLIFVSDRNGVSALWSVGFNNGRVEGQPSRLAKVDFGPRYRPISLTPSGAFYYQSQPSAASRIDVVSFDFSIGQLTSNPTTVSDVGKNSSPEWSPDGRSLAYVSERGQQFFIVVRSVDSSTKREISLKLKTAENHGLRWSPDSRSLALIGQDARNQQGLFLLDVKIGSLSAVALAEPKPDVGTIETLDNPHFSADGKILYFDRIRAPLTAAGTIELTRTEKDLASGREKALLQMRGNTNFLLIAISKDGTRLYYRRSFPSELGVVSGNPNAQKFAFVERDLVSGAERELLQAESLGHVNLSPDGVNIASAGVWGSSGRSLILVPVAGGEPRRLFSNPPSGASFGLWAPDGQSILAYSSGPWWVPVGPGTAHRIEWPKLPSGTTLGPVSPDGRQIAYAVVTQPPPAIWMIKNLLRAPVAR